LEESTIFKRFFSALANLTGNIETLAASFAEANKRFRHNVLGDGNDEFPVLNHLAESEETARIGRKKAGAK
jgi:hypothetical protein